MVLYDEFLPFSKELAGSLIYVWTMVFLGQVWVVQCL
jgi:hypothetical protein